MHRCKYTFTGTLACIIRFSPRKSRASSKFLQFNHRIMNMYLFVLRIGDFFSAFRQQNACYLFLASSGESEDKSAISVGFDLYNTSSKNILISKIWWRAFRVETMSIYLGTGFWPNLQNQKAKILHTRAFQFPHICERYQGLHYTFKNSFVKGSLVLGVIIGISVQSWNVK